MDGRPCGLHGCGDGQFIKPGRRWFVRSSRKAWHARRIVQSIEFAATKEAPIMRHLLSLLLLTAAVVAYVAGIGPLFFGTPLVGCVLMAMGLALEWGFWRRLIRPVRQLP